MKITSKQELKESAKAAEALGALLRDMRSWEDLDGFVAVTFNDGDVRGVCYASAAALGALTKKLAQDLFEESPKTFLEVAQHILGLVEICVKQTEQTAH